jgi:hypothetical protein
VVIFKLFGVVHSFPTEKIGRCDLDMGAEGNGVRSHGVKSQTQISECSSEVCLAPCTSFYAQTRGCFEAESALSLIHCAARALLMPSRFPLPWTLEKQAERGNSYSSRRAGLYVMPDAEHRIAPCVIAALTSLVHDGQSAADYHHDRAKDNY